MTEQYIRRLLKFFYPLVKKLLPYQVYAYLAVGAANTVLNITLFATCYWLIVQVASISATLLPMLKLAVEIATTISFVITVFTGFWLSKKFAFTSADNKKTERAKQFGKYFLVSLEGQLSDYLITKGLIVLLLVNPVTAYLISTAVMLLINYFLQKNYTFKPKSANATNGKYFSWKTNC
jgi:putative flippase GtrA